MSETAAIDPIVVDLNGFFDHLAGQNGLAREEVTADVERAGSILAELALKRAGGDLPFYELPHDLEAIEQVERVAARIRREFDCMIVLGIGGSALGTKAAIEAVPPACRASGGIRVEVLDNVDPATISRLLDEVDLERTVFNVISKSGQTAETMSQFLIVRARLRAALGDDYRGHIICTTDPESGTLRDIADNEGFETLPVPPGVGGRFSVMSAVGLLPIAAAGLDIAGLAAGARAMDKRTSEADPWRNPAALQAALIYTASQRHGMGIHVMMPYCDGLLRIAEWYAQLWAESLGKRLALDGSVVETGHTPVRALGATDQHSQVQLYIEGPRDKIVTFLRVEQPHGDIEIPAGYPDNEGLSYLSGHTLGALLNMEQRATELALAQAGRLTSVLEIQVCDEAAVGQIFHLLEVQTLIMGGLLGIDPLDQPGVEAGKLLTYAMAGRKGYEDLSGTVNTLLQSKRRDLVLG